MNSGSRSSNHVPVLFFIFIRSFYFWILLPLNFFLDRTDQYLIKTTISTLYKSFDLFFPFGNILKFLNNFWTYKIFSHYGNSRKFLEYLEVLFPDIPEEAFSFQHFLEIFCEVASKYTNWKFSSARVYLEASSRSDGHSQQKMRLLKMKRTFCA